MLQLTPHIANPPCSHLPLPDQNESPAAEISTSETGNTSQHQNQSTNEHAAGMKSINPATSQGSKKSINASPQLTEEPVRRKSKITCPHYRNNICKYGPLGKECPLTHPPKCKKTDASWIKQKKRLHTWGKMHLFPPKNVPSINDQGEMY